jgi:ribosomal protein S20
MANEGSPEWIAADREAGKASTDIAYYNSKINGADAKAELGKALESGDPLQIAWARARVGELYDDGAADPQPTAMQQTTAKSVSSDPAPAANWSSIAKSQISGLPNQFKNDAEIAQAREQADQITDPTAKLSVTDAIDKIASKGTIEGNKAARVKKLSDANAEYKKTGVNPNPSLFKVSTDANGEWILTWK